MLEPLSRSQVEKSVQQADFLGANGSEPRIDPVIGFSHCLVVASPPILAGSVCVRNEISYHTCDMRSLSDDRFLGGPVEECYIEMWSSCAHTFIWIYSYLERVISGMVPFASGYPCSSA